MLNLRLFLKFVFKNGPPHQRKVANHFGHPVRYLVTWWRHQMETFSRLLALFPGNSLVTGEFPAQRPMTRSFDVFFDLRLNKRLSKQSWRWWFETPLRPLWRHCYDSSVNHIKKLVYANPQNTKKQHPGILLMVCIVSDHCSFWFIFVKAIIQYIWRTCCVYLICRCTRKISPHMRVVVPKAVIKGRDK